MTDISPEICLCLCVMALIMFVLAWAAIGSKMGK